MIKVFMFDIGGVIIKYTNAEYYDYLNVVSGIGKAQIEANIEPLIAKLEMGEINYSDFEKKASKILNITRGELRWMDFFKKNMVINKEVLSMIREIGKDHIVAFLSNVDKPRYLHVIKFIHPELFDYKFASCYLKMRKPDIEVYKFVVQKIGIKPNEVVFIDDRKENIYCAKVAGLHGIHFVNAKDLKKSIAKIVHLK